MAESHRFILSAAEAGTNTNHRRSAFHQRINMNVFEDLIEELREENLLEEKVGDSQKRPGGSPELLAKAVNHNGRFKHSSTGTKNGNGAGEHLNDPASSDDQSEPVDDRDFYRKRAIDEVSSLQMVEHVLCAVERERLKIVPVAYDDLQAKKALHNFLQVQGAETSSEYADAEFRLMQEIEAWSSALSKRDENISASNLRRYCENSRPALSSRALMSLGRFYRNAAYSEASRAKFELVMTRLFSRDLDGEKRRLLFSPADMIGHIQTLYANWSSVALYSTDAESMSARAVVSGFADRVSEVEDAQTFEYLIQHSFFDKVHEFKETIGETFFSPDIVAAAIDCNIRVGNKFVDLVQLERQNSNVESVEQKYGYEYDGIISEAAAKTLQLVELLRSLPAEEMVEPKESEPAAAKSVSPSSPKSTSAPKTTSNLFRVNKWLLVFTVLVVLASVGLYFWSGKTEADSSATNLATDVDLAGSDLSEFLRSGRATEETFYAITLPSWDQLSEDRKKEVLQKADEWAKQKGLRYVRLLSVRGDLEAFTSATRTEVIHRAP